MNLQRRYFRSCKSEIICHFSIHKSLLCIIKFKFFCLNSTTGSELGQKIRTQSSCPNSNGSSDNTEAFVCLSNGALLWNSFIICLNSNCPISVLSYLRTVPSPNATQSEDQFKFIKGEYWLYFYDIKWMKTTIYILIINKAHRSKA